LVYYALSGEKITLNADTKTTTSAAPDYADNEEASFDENTYSKAVNFLQQLADDSASAESTISSYAELNYQIEGLPGDYLEKYINDVNIRSTNLIADFQKLKADYDTLEAAKSSSNTNISSEAKSLQAEIVRLIAQESVNGDFQSLMATVSADLVNHGDALASIQTCQNSTLRNEKIISLYNTEISTTGLLKDKVDSFLLPLSSDVRAALVRAEFVVLAAQSS
jgi:hypothetical protein